MSPEASKSWRGSGWVQRGPVGRGGCRLCSNTNRWQSIPLPWKPAHYHPAPWQNLNKIRPVPPPASPAAPKAVRPAEGRQRSPRGSAHVRHCSCGELSHPCSCDILETTLQRGQGHCARFREAQQLVPVTQVGHDSCRLNPGRSGSKMHAHALILVRGAAAHTLAQQAARQAPLRPRPSCWEP